MHSGRGPRGLIVVVLLATGLVSGQAAVAFATDAQVANCVANVTGAPQTPRTKRSYCSEMIADLSLIGSRLGLPIIPLMSTPRANGFQLDFSNAPDPDEPKADASTEFNVASPCYIVMYPRLWQSASKVESRAHLDLLHEAVHCYQGLVFGSQEAVSATPKFIIEGSAEYLGSLAAGYSAAPGIPSWWPVWFNPATPQPSLLKRSYDALGWYALLAQVRGSLWREMPSAWRAYTSGGDDAFIESLGGNTKAVEEEWGPALVNDPLWGPPWVAQGPGIPPDSYATGVTGVGAGYLPPWSGEVDFRPPTGKELLLVHVTNGYAAVHDAYHDQAVGITDQLFCQSQTPFGCGYNPITCESGTNITVDKLYGEYTLAVSSDGTPASFTVQRYSNVNDIPSDISPCDQGVPMATLRYFGNHPCLLLFDSDTNTNHPTSNGEIVWSEEATSSQGGLCSWGVQKNGIIPVDGEISIQQEPWAQVQAQATANVRDIGGLGENAFCVPGTSRPGYTPDLFVELNSEWAVGISGAPPGNATGTGACGALVALAHEALGRLR